MYFQACGSHFRLSFFVQTCASTPGSLPHSQISTHANTYSQYTMPTTTAPPRQHPYSIPTRNSTRSSKCPTLTSHRFHRLPHPRLYLPFLPRMLPLHFLIQQLRRLQSLPPSQSRRQLLSRRRPSTSSLGSPTQLTSGFPPPRMYTQWPSTVLSFLMASMEVSTPPFEAHSAHSSSPRRHRKGRPSLG